MPATTPAPASEAAKPQVTAAVGEPATPRRRRSWRELGVVLLARTAHQLVAALAAVQRVIAGATVQRVRAFAAHTGANFRP